MPSNLGMLTNSFEELISDEHFLDEEAQTAQSRSHTSLSPFLTEIFREVEVNNDASFQDTLSQDRSAGASALEELNALSGNPISKSSSCNLTLVTQIANV
jgi:hypothetical protein